MAISDEIHEQQKKLGDMTWKQKLSYIIYYYKFHILAALFVIIIVSVFIHDIVTRKEPALYCAMINSIPYDSELTTLREDFGKYADIDLNKMDIILDCSMNIDYEAQDQMTYGYVQKLLALLNTGDIDVFIANKPVVDNYGQIAAFKNIMEVLPDDLKQQLEGEFDYYYYDLTDEDTGETTTMPIGIHIYNSRILQECYEANGLRGMYTEQMDPIFCIATNAQNTENAVKFLRFLLSENSVRSTSSHSQRGLLRGEVLNLTRAFSPQICAAEERRVFTQQKISGSSAEGRYNPCIRKRLSLRLTSYILLPPA